MLRSRLVFAFILVASAFGIRGAAVLAEPLHLILPTSNDALYRDDGPGFYMYTDRYFQGQRSRPWQGGQYGYVRNAKEVGRSIVYTRFHEGVDIRPVYRDAAGEPLDSVRTVDDGYVVYVNRDERRSSYGKYVVVEHWWSGAPFYSLYAHLKDVHVRQGQQVVQGQRLGLMGYTGPGLNRRRAHLHFEINVLLNQEYDHWHGAHLRSVNRHGVFNGMNLAGLDVAALYLAMYRDPSLTIEQFFAQQEAFFTVTVPNEGQLALTYRYPWMLSQRHPWLTNGIGGGRVASWEIAFTQSGLPLRVEPSGRRVPGPDVSVMRRSNVPYNYLTSGTLTGSGGNVALSPSGERYLSLLTSSVVQGAYEQQATAGSERIPVRPVEHAAGQGGGQPAGAVERLSLEEALRRVEVEVREREQREERGARVRGW